jgi:hypothetical protein
MSKITRAHQKVFGDTAPATGQFGKFGSLAAGAPQYSKDPTEIQSLAAWLLGWSAATVGTKSPALEDMNGLFYLTFRQLAYTLQAGLPEWNAETDYHTNDFCRVGTVVYVSLTNNNINNLVTDTNNWRRKDSLDLEFRYPVGEVFITNRAGNPLTLLGFGTWELISQGQAIVGLSTTDSDFNAIAKTGGAKTHTLSIAELPPQLGLDGLSSPGITATSNPGTRITTVGGGQPHNNLQPYRVLAVWLRTA